MHVCSHLVLASGNDAHVGSQELEPVEGRRACAPPRERHHKARRHGHICIGERVSFWSICADLLIIAGEGIVESSTAQHERRRCVDDIHGYAVLW